MNIRKKMIIFMIAFSVLSTLLMIFGAFSLNSLHFKEKIDKHFIVSSNLVQLSLVQLMKDLETGLKVNHDNKELTRDLLVALSAKKPKRSNFYNYLFTLTDFAKQYEVSQTSVHFISSRNKKLHLYGVVEKGRTFSFSTKKRKQGKGIIELEADNFGFIMPKEDFSGEKQFLISPYPKHKKKNIELTRKGYQMFLDFHYPLINQTMGEEKSKSTGFAYLGMKYGLIRLHKELSRNWLRKLEEKTEVTLNIYLPDGSHGLGTLPGKLSPKTLKSLDLFQYQFKDTGYIGKSFPIYLDDKLQGYLVTSIPESVLLDQEINTSLILLLIGLVILLVSIPLASLILWRTFIRPIIELRNGADELAGGNLNVSIDVNRKDEFGNLAESFTIMRDSIRKNIEDLHTLNKTGEILAGIHSKEKALETVLNVMSSHFNFDRSSIYLLNQDGELELSACSPLNNPDNPVKKFKKDGKGIANIAFSEKRVILIPDTSKSPDFIPGDEGRNQCSLLCVPMLDDQEVYGVMNFSGEISTVHFEPENEGFAATLARMTVVILKNIEMLHVIEEQNRTLEMKVRQRTAAIKELMDNTGQGFFSFGKDYKIRNEYSKACLNFFNKPIENIDALELLFPEKMEAVKETLEVVFDGVGELMLVEELLPKEIILEDMILSVGYKWIPSSGEVDDDKFMIILTDITQERKLEEKIKADEEQNEIIIKVAVDRDGFLQLVREVNQLLDKNDQILQRKPETIDTNELFRYYHTIKGGAATYALKDVSKKAHSIEYKLEGFRSGEEKLTMELSTDLYQENQALRATLESALDSLKDLISPDELDSKCGKCFKIPENKLKCIENILSHASVINRLDNIKETYQELQQQGEESIISESLYHELGLQLQQLRTQPIGSLFKKFANSAKQLAEELNKQVQVELVGSDVEVDYDYLGSFFNTMIHLIRNSVDHGIEEPEIREMLGKSAVGVISLQADQVDNNLILTVKDDGGGIDPEKIVNVAIKKEILDPAAASSLNDDEILRLIFAPGFSTNESVTEVSGRGVGMDAIQSTLTELGGQIRIDSELDMGSTFTITIPTNSQSGFSVAEAP